MIAKLIIFGVVACIVIWAIKLLNKAGKPPKDGDGDGGGDKQTVNLRQDDDGTYRPDDD